MFLRRFDPFAIDPLLLVNREADLDWLTGAISEYLRDPDGAARGRLSFCILGEKGVGKTILTRNALRRVRQDFSDRAIFVEADCRRFRTAKEVIDALAKNIVEQLDDLGRTGTLVPKELLATAQALAAITRFEEAELNIVHQHLEQFKAATSLKGERSLLRALKLDFQISIELTSSTARGLSGKVRFDEMRLCNALSALLRDIRESDIDVVLYIDNMDELSHHFRTAEDRERARRDTEVLLTLRDAPVVFIVNMRTYYSGILPREIANRRVLRALPEGELFRILERRIEPERPEVKRALDLPAVRETLHELAAFAPTPLAFLTWFKALFEEGALSKDTLETGVNRFLETYYSTLPTDVWRCVVNAFERPDSAINREALLAACKGNEAQLLQIVDRQGVLPKDFWDPTTYYTLDPELYLVHADLPAKATKV